MPYDSNCGEVVESTSDPSGSKVAPQTIPLPTLKRKQYTSTSNNKEIDLGQNSSNIGPENDVIDTSDHSRVTTGASKKFLESSKVPRSGPYWAHGKRRGDTKGKLQKGRKDVKGVETHVGFTKAGELHMVVGNLPCDPDEIDSEDIELVRTGRKGTERSVREVDDSIISNLSDESIDIIDGSKIDNEEVVRKLKSRDVVNANNPVPGSSSRKDEKRTEQKGNSSKTKLKLKVITLRKQSFGSNEIKQGRFVREGEFNDKFRLPYSKREEEAIINYMLEEGGFRLRKGNKIWELMEEKGICPGRTWQSMKQRWDKFISKSLDKFGVTVDELEQRDEKDKSESEDDAEVSQRGFRGNANYYTNIEDLKIIEFMVSNQRFDVGGRALWQVKYFTGCLCTLY